VSDIIVLDDVISPDAQDKLWDLMQDYRFSWHFGPSNIYEDETNNDQCFRDSNTIDSFQFTHLLLNSQIPFKEPFFENFREPLITMFKSLGLDNRNLFRVKCNMLTNNRKFEKTAYNPAHVDGEFVHWVVVYYVNDTDGDTIIFNETYGSKFDKLTVKQRVSPKKGRAVAFPGKYFHASSNPIDVDVRCVININLSESGKIIL
jgi:hypothetical protein